MAHAIKRAALAGGALGFVACGTVAHGGPGDAGPADSPHHADGSAGLAGDGGATIVASQIQLPPNRLVSDGTSLFWTTTASPGLLTMPVGGGNQRVLLADAIVNNFNTSMDTVPDPSAFFLGVDALNVYVLQNNTLIRVPKNGSPSTLVSEPGAQLAIATILGATAYWVEMDGIVGFGASQAAKSAPLAGGPVSTIGTYTNPNPPPLSLGVTSDALFIGGPGSALLSFPLSGVPSGGPMSAPQSCYYLASDTDAVYCAPQNGGENLVIGSSGATNNLGLSVGSSYIVSDDSFVYWADMATVGTIVRAPKGGGTAVVLAQDTSPTAIAVDASSVYWSDVGGFIKSIPK